MGKDITRDFDYERLIDEEKEHYSNIEVTEKLTEGGRHATDAWHYYWEGIGAIVAKTPFCNIGQFLESTVPDGDGQLKILSLGSGYCGHEIMLAESLNHDYKIICVDINDKIFAQARKICSRKGLNLDFRVGDLNFIEIEKGSYDLIIAHASLHHVINLEHLLDEVRDGLKKLGIFYIVDVIGKNRKLLWEENERLVNAILASFPEEIVKGARVAAAEDLEGMEGIRQEETLGVLRERFEPLFEHMHGAFMRFICTDQQLSENLSPRCPETRKYLDFLIDVDKSAVKLGILRPLEIWGVYRPSQQ